MARITAWYCKKNKEFNLADASMHDGVSGELFVDSSLPVSQERSWARGLISEDAAREPSVLPTTGSVFIGPGKITYMLADELLIDARFDQLQISSNFLEIQRLLYAMGRTHSRPVTEPCLWDLAIVAADAVDPYGNLLFKNKQVAAATLEALNQPAQNYLLMIPAAVADAHQLLPLKTPETIQPILRLCSLAIPPI